MRSTFNPVHTPPPFQVYLDDILSERAWTSMPCAQPLVAELAEAVRPEAPPSPAANTPDHHSPAAIAASPGWDFAEEEDEGWEAVGGGASGAGVTQGVPAVGNSSGIGAAEAAGVRYTALRRSEARDLATGAAEESLSSLRPGNMERHPFFKALKVLICLPEASGVRHWERETF